MKTFKLVKEFKRNYPSTLVWFRKKAHCKLVEKYLHPGEEVIFAFPGQLKELHATIFNTAVLALTSERVILAQDRLLVGYKLSSVTPDLYNDLKVSAGLIWGTITIDTVKEEIILGNLSKKSLTLIQEKISTYMLEEKRKYSEEGK